MYSIPAPPPVSTVNLGVHRGRWLAVLLGVTLLSVGCGKRDAAPAGDEDAVAATAPTASAPSVCAPGTQCIAVDDNGTPNPAGTSVAQCSGTFPDYVVEASLFPAGYAGPWFFMAEDFPTEVPPADGPWQSIDFMDGVEGADAYLYAMRDYAYEGNLEIDFRVQENDVRPWFTMPLMNYGPGRREMVHGVTQERSLEAPELGIKPGVTVDNYAIGFYNAPGGFTVGQVWQNPNDPDLAASQFADGTMVFKILFSDATPDDFVNPDDYILEGAPEWQIATGNGELTTVRLLQMDVAARDDRAPETGWVFGTFAYQKDAPDENPWLRMRPVGLAWGNDPGYTPTEQQEGVPLEEGTVSDEIPAYAATHLGWAGRVNGPVDNPISACTSCHMTSQFPVDADMAPFATACQTDEQKLWWFRNLAGDEPFGAVDDNTCLPEPPPSEPPVALDYSLQMQVAVQNLLQYRDVNPCLDGIETLGAGRTGRVGDAPRVGRGGFHSE